MSMKTPPPSTTDDSEKQPLTERSEDSEYETISQEEGLGSPLVAPYTIDDDFSSYSSPRPLTKAQEETTTSRTTEQSKSTTSAPSSQKQSQEQVTQEGTSSQHPPAGGPSHAGAAADKNTFSSTPPSNQGSTPKSSSVSQAPSLPNNQQATMSPNARANLSQQMNHPAEASDQPQEPIASSNDNGNSEQQQQQQQPQGSGRHHHINLRIFVLQRRAPNATAVFMHYLLNVLKICFFATILYNMYNKEVFPSSAYNSKEKVYVLKRM